MVKMCESIVLLNPQYGSATTGCMFEVVAHFTQKQALPANVAAKLAKHLRNMSEPDDRDLTRAIGAIYEGWYHPEFAVRESLRKQLNTL